MRQITQGPNEATAASGVASHEYGLRQEMFSRSCSPLPQPSGSGSPHRASDVDVARVVRTHFAREILDALRGIADHHGDPQAARFAGVVLRQIRALEDVAPRDPFTGLAIALHDALAYENQWADYTPDQYAGAINLLQGCATNDRLDHRTVRRAWRELEGKLEFDTVPLGYLLLDDTE